MRYATAVRLALEGSARRQKIATAFLKKSDHRFLHKELANHLGIPQVTLNGEFGKLGRHIDLGAASGRSASGVPVVFGIGRIQVVRRWLDLDCSRAVH